MRRTVFAVCLALLPGMAVAQVKAVAPIKTTLCELVKESVRFNGEIVQVRARIRTGFETTVLLDDSCNATIWLMWRHGTYTTSEEDEIVAYAYIESRSELRHPEDLKWKPIEQLRAVTLREDEPYCMLDRYLGKFYGLKERTGVCHSLPISCPAYAVTATFTGRFDHRTLRLRAIRGKNPGEVGISDGGFGHLGGYESQLALGSVSDVVAKPIDRSVYERRK